MAVQRTPKAEQTTLGRLADALGKVNPIIAKYGDAQIAENERQILDVQQKIASMDPKEKERLFKASEAEVNLSKAFRDDYELNPVPTIRLKMLLGAEKNEEFISVLDAGVEDFKNNFIRENGDKPSYIQVSKELDTITQNYMESSGLNGKDKGLMRAGFLQEASVYINKLKQTLPSEMAEVHKLTYLIPKLSRKLARHHRLPGVDKDPDALRNIWESFTNSLSISEKTKAIDDTLGLLNFDSGTDELESAIDFLTDLKDAGIRIGNQPIDSDSSALPDSYYKIKIDDLNNLRSTVYRKEKAEALIRTEVFENDATQMMREFSDGGGSEDSPAVEERMRQMIASIDNDPTTEGYEKAAKRDALDRAKLNGFKQVREDTDEMQQAADGAGSAISIASVNREITSLLIKKAQSDLADIPGVTSEDIADALIINYTDTDATDPYSTRIYDTLGIGAKLRSIDNKSRQAYSNKRADTIDYLVRVKPGEQFKLPGSDTTYVIGERDNIKNKRNEILAAHMTEIIPSIIETATKDLVSVVESGIQKSEDRTTAKNEKDKSLEQLAAEKGLKEKSQRMLDTKPEKVRGKESVAKGLAGTGIELQRELGALGDFLGADMERETPVNMPGLYDSVEHVLKYNPYTPEKTKIILERAEAVHNEAAPIMKLNLMEALKISRSTGPRALPKRKEAEARYAEITSQFLRARRLFKGFTFDEIKIALSGREGEAGYLPEGVRIADPKSFFKQELAGENETNYQPSALIKDITPEQRIELGAMLELDPKRIESSQLKLKDAMSGRKPQKPKPTVPKAKTKKTPTPPVSETKELPRIRTIEEIRADREEQLELNLDEPVKPNPEVETKVTGTEGDITIYSPQKGGDKMEGGYPSSRPGPDGKALVRTVQDYANGTSEYITLAGNPSFYNKSYIIPELPYEDPKTGTTKTLRNVRAVVHDTGGAFKTKPEFRYDIPYGRDLTNKQMTRYNGILKKKGIQFIDAVEPRDSEPLASDQPPADDGELKGTGFLPRIN